MFNKQDLIFAYREFINYENKHNFVYYTIDK